MLPHGRKTADKLRDYNQLKSIIFIYDGLQME